MQPDQFFKELEDARSRAGLDQRVRTAMEGCLESLSTLFDYIVQCDTAAQRVYPGTSGVDRLPSVRTGSYSPAHSRDASLDNLLRYRVVNDLRFISREADRASRRIVQALRGTGNPTEPKLSEVERAQLSYLLEKGESPSKLAREFGISRSMVYKYGRRKKGATK